MMLHAYALCKHQQAKLVKVEADYTLILLLQLYFPNSAIIYFVLFYFLFFDLALYASPRVTSELQIALMNNYFPIFVYISRILLVNYAEANHDVYRIVVSFIVSLV